MGRGAPSRDVRRWLVMGKAPKTQILASYGISQAVIIATSIARIPVIIDSIGPAGYGVLLAVTSLTPWLLLLLGGLTNLSRVAVAEAFGVEDDSTAWQAFERLRRRAYAVGFCVLVSSLAAAALVPWGKLLLGSPVDGITEAQVAWGIAMGGALVATAAPGAVYQGLLHAERRVAFTSLLPGVAALLSLVATVAAAFQGAPFLVFVTATLLASCAPYWLVHAAGRGSRHRLLSKASAGHAAQDSTRTGARQLMVMTGAAAPPPFSTGWDPLILGSTAGPGAVASYGLAGRLALMVTFLPSALYPHFWSEYARLRAAGNIHAVRAQLRRDVFRVGGGTGVLGAIFVLVGPFCADILSNGSVSQPRWLYVAMALFGVCAAVQTVLFPALGGRSSAPIVAGLVYALILPNILLSYVLAKSTGAAGPVVASIICSISLIGASWVLLRVRPGVLLSGNVRESHNIEGGGA